MKRDYVIHHPYPHPTHSTYLSLVSVGGRTISMGWRKVVGRVVVGLTTKPWVPSCRERENVLAGRWACRNKMRNVCCLLDTVE